MNTHGKGRTMQQSARKQSNFFVIAFLVSLAYVMIILLMDKALV